MRLDVTPVRTLCVAEDVKPAYTASSVTPLTPKCSFIAAFSNVSQALHASRPSASYDPPSQHPRMSVAHYLHQELAVHCSSLRLQHHYQHHYHSGQAQCSQRQFAAVLLTADALSHHNSSDSPVLPLAGCTERSNRSPVRCLAHCR